MNKNSCSSNLSLHTATFQIDTILYYSDGGINKAVENWGRILTTRYHKRRSYMESDFTINYLGYWTDNGEFCFCLMWNDKDDLLLVALRNLSKNEESKVRWYASNKQFKAINVC